MTAAEVRRLCLSLDGATENVQWEDVRAFKVGGKLFVCTGLEEDSWYSFKVDDERFVELTDQPGIVPAPYLARAKWVHVDPADSILPRDELEALVRRSWELVFRKLTKKAQRKIRAG